MTEAQRTKAVWVGDHTYFIGKYAQPAANILGLTLTTEQMPNGDVLPVCSFVTETHRDFAIRMADAGFALAIFTSLEGFFDSEQAEEDISEELRIYIDREAYVVTWIYYNPDAEAGGQFVTSSLDWNVFASAYDDFVALGGDFTDEKQLDAFVDNLVQTADCELADIGCPLFYDALYQFSEEPDYVEFTPDNIKQIYDIVTH